MLDPLYIARQDGADSSASAVHWVPIATQVLAWQEQSTTSTDFAGVDLTVVTMMSIDVGEPGSTEPGTACIVYVDDTAPNRPPESWRSIDATRYGPRAAFTQEPDTSQGRRETGPLALF